MSKLKLNGVGHEEILDIFLTERDHPVAYQNYLNQLVANGWTELAARAQIKNYPIELELYYEPEAGLFAVEQGAVEAGLIFSPYTAEPIA